MKATVRPFLFIALTLCSCFPAIAQSTGKKASLSFTVAPLIINYGYLGEYVYSLDSDGTYKKLSYLEWEMKPTQSLGATIEASISSFSVSGHCSAGLPFSCGNMYDSDWISLTDVKNDYSISENTLNSDFTAGFEIAYEFDLDPFFQIAPIFGFDFSYIDFSANNGYGWYGDYRYSLTGSSVSWDSSDAHFFASGELFGIDYTRATTYTWIGFRNTVTPNRSISFGLSCSIAPYVYVTSLDKHYSNTQKTICTAYNDIMESYLCYGKNSVFFSYACSKYCTVGANIQYWYGISTLGITYTHSIKGSTETTPYLDSTKSKNSISEVSASFYCQIRFF